MEISLDSFATKQRATDGVIMPVRINGVKMPIAINILGSDSDVIQEYEKDKIRNLGLGKKGKKEIDEDDIDNLLDSKNKDALVRINGVFMYDWENKEVVEEGKLVLKGKEIKNDSASYKFLLSEIPSLIDWVIEQSNNRLNFLGDRKKN